MKKNAKIELTEIQQMQSKESFSQFEHKVFKSKLNGLIEVKSACSSLRTIIHKINVDLMLDLNVINATVLVTKLNFVG
jgi:hypothetical protein